MNKMGWDSGAGRCVMGGVCNGVRWGGMEGGGMERCGLGWAMGLSEDSWPGERKGVGVLVVLGRPGADLCCTKALKLASLKGKYLICRSHWRGLMGRRFTKLVKLERQTRLGWGRSLCDFTKCSLLSSDMSLSSLAWRGRSW